MLHIAVCDDDAHMRAYLTGLCTQNLPGSSIHAYSSGKQLLCSKVDFDIVLMDIQLGELDGLQVVAQLRGQPTPGLFQRPAVIFITAFDEHVFAALDLFPYHYLLKPLDEKKFQRVISSAAQSCLKAQNEETLFFRTQKSHRKLYGSEIYYVESNLRKVVIHTEHEALEIYATMDSMEDKLKQCFFRCHRGYLVNMDKISSYDQKSIRLQNGAELLMSRSRYPAFVEAYLSFLKHEEAWQSE